MEEKLAKLIMAIKEFSEKSSIHYAEIRYSGSYNELELYIREKVTHDFVEERKIYLNFSDLNNIDEIIEFINKYIERNEAYE
ncbi:MAG: hypothetical protein HFJ55_02205 [Clostridia bacterium]|nr:hypothetical protein [Clostridia bacterium]